MAKTFAIVEWVPEDVLDHAPKDWTKQDAIAFLKEHEDELQIALMDKGFSLIKRWLQD